MIWNGRTVVHTSHISSNKLPSFVLCASKESFEAEAREHFENAREELINGIGHAAAAGVTFEVCPPLAGYELYQSAKSFKKMGEEYHRGVECERQAESDSMDRFEPPSSSEAERDREADRDRCNGRW